MATRLYAVADGTAPPISPNPDAAWQATTGFLRRSMDTVKAAATETRSGVVVASGANSETLGWQLISPPLSGAQTITGTVTIMMRGLESAANDNINARARGIRVIQSDGTTVRGTLLTQGFHSVTTELGVALAGTQHANATAVTSVAAQTGDRIVVEVGYGMTATGTSPAYDMVIGGNGTDHANTDLDTTGTVPWVEFSQNLTFQTVTTLAGLGVAQAQKTRTGTDNAVALTQVHVLAGLGVAQAQAATGPTLEEVGGTPTLAGMGVAQTQKVGQGLKPSPVELEGDFISWVVDSDISGNSNGSTLSLVPDVWPSNLKTGDYVVIYVTTGTTGPPTISATAPDTTPYVAGAFIDGGTVGRLQRFSRRIATDGEGAPTFTFSISTNVTMVGEVFRTVDSTTPIDVTETTLSSPATATSAALPNLTTVTAGDWLLVGMGSRVAAPPYPVLSGPGTHTERQQRRSTSGAGAGTSTAFFTRNTNPVAIGTYGGDSFTHDIAAGARILLIHTALRKAQVTTPTLAGLGVAQGQSATNLTLTQLHVLAGLNVAQAQAATLTGLTQLHILAGLGVAQAQDTADPTLTQVHVLAGLNIAQGQASTVITLTGFPRWISTGVASTGVDSATLQSVLPTGLAQLDLLIMDIFHAGPDTVTITTDLAALGWAFQANAKSGFGQTWRYTKIAGASESAPSLTFSAINGIVILITAVREPGAVGNSLTAVDTGINTTALTVPSLSVGTNSLVMVAFGGRGATPPFSTITPDPDYVERAEASSGGSSSGGTLEVATRGPTVTGTLSGDTWSQSTTGRDALIITEILGAGATPTLAGMGVAQAQTSTAIALVQQHTLAGLNVAQAQATADPTLAVTHVLTGLNVAQAQAGVIGRFTYILQGLNVAQAQAATLTGLTQVHILAGLGVAQVQSVPQVVVNSATNLANLGVAQAQSAVLTGLTQVHVLAGLGVAQPQAGVFGRLTYILAGLNVAQAQATADPTLVQNSSIAGMGVGQGQSAVLIGLTQLHILAGLGVAQPQSVPQVGISSAGALSGMGVAQSQAMTGPTLVRMFNLLGLGVAQPQAMTHPVLGFGLMGLGVAQPTTATMLVLIQTHVLVGLGVLTPQQAQVITLAVGALPLIRFTDGRVVERYGDGQVLRPAEGRVVPRGNI